MGSTIKDALKQNADELIKLIKIKYQVFPYIEIGR